MAHEVEQRGDVLLVTLHGGIGEIEAPQLERELQSFIERGSIKLVLDLADVPFVTSSALVALMVADKPAKQRQGYVRIVRPQPLVRQVLETTRLATRFGLYLSVEAAIAAP